MNNLCNEIVLNIYNFLDINSMFIFSNTCKTIYILFRYDILPYIKIQNYELNYFLSNFLKKYDIKHSYEDRYIEGYVADPYHKRLFRFHKNYEEEGVYISFNYYCDNHFTVSISRVKYNDDHFPITNEQCDEHLHFEGKDDNGDINTKYIINLITFFDKYIKKNKNKLKDLLTLEFTKKFTNLELYE